MKTSLVLITICAVASTVEAAVLEFEFTGKDSEGYTTDYLSGDGWALTGRSDWTDEGGNAHKSWNPVYTNKQPSATDLVAFTPATIVIDGQYTFHELLTPGNGALDMVVRMSDADGVYTNQSLTLDGNTTTAANTDYDGSDIKVLQMRQYGKDGNMTFENGVINLTKSDAVGGSSTLQFDIYSNSDRRTSEAAKVFNKSLSILQDATINSTEHFHIKGCRIENVNYSKVNIDGTINCNVGTGDTPYKNFTISNMDATISQTANITARDIVFNYTNITFNDSVNLHNYRTNFQNSTKVNIAEGAVIKGGGLIVQSGSEMTLAGTYITIRDDAFAAKDANNKYIYADIDNLTVSSKLTITSTGKLDVNQGYYCDVNLNDGGHITIENGGKLITNRWLRMGGNAKLTINGDNGLLYSETGSSSSSLIWLWAGTQRVEINANTSLAGFCFSPRSNSTSTVTTVLTLALGSDVTFLNLNTLTAATDGFSGFLTDGTNLVIEGFKNDTIKITSLRTGYTDSKTGKYAVDDLTRISADGYEEGSFYLEFINGIDANDGYWLNAIAIPEPATLAALLGALAMALAIYRKRK